MSTIREEANQYEPPQTLNITDLERVDVNIEVKDSEEKTNSKGEKYSYKYVEVDDKEYRIAGVVLGALKELMIAMPTLTTFRVTKTGVEKQTRYQVIPLDAPASQDTAEQVE